MKTSNIISLAVAAMSILGAAGARAEAYDGVHPLATVNGRAEVRAEAVVAAHSANPYADVSDSAIPAVVGSVSDRSVVRAQAVAAAHSANPYADGAQANMPSVVASSIDRATVRAQAVAAAHSPSMY